MQSQAARLRPFLHNMPSPLSPLPSPVLHPLPPSDSGTLSILEKSIESSLAVTFWKDSASRKNIIDITTAKRTSNSLSESKYGCRCSQRATLSLIHLILQQIVSQTAQLSITGTNVLKRANLWSCVALMAFIIRSQTNYSSKHKVPFTDPASNDAIRSAASGLLESSLASFFNSGI